MSNQPSNAQPTTPGQGANNGSPQPEYITPAFFEQKLQETRQEFEERLAKQYQGVQSITDKMKAELKNFDATLKQLQAAGVTIDASKINEVRNRIMADSLSQEQAAQPQTPTQPAGQPSPGMDEGAALNLINAIEASHGVSLFDDDPEVEQLPDINTVGDKVFFEKLGELLEVKKQRLAKETPQRAVARSPLLGTQGAPASNPTQGLSHDQLWDAYKNKSRG